MLSKKLGAEDGAVITLSPVGWEELQRMLREPLPANERLERAFAEHARIIAAKRPKTRS